MTSNLRRDRVDAPRTPPSGPTPRIWSAEAWHALTTRIERMTHGGGTLSLNFVTANTGNVRWARNRITTSGDLRQNTLTIHRSQHTQGEQSLTLIDPLDDDAMRAGLAYLEQAIGLYDRELFEEYLEPPFRQEDYLQPTLWCPSTWAVDGAQRATAAATVIRPAAQAGLLSAGYLAVTGYGVAVTHPWQELALYYPVTEAQYSVTVRDPQGTASGWAGVNWNDWTRIDMAQLSAIALDKCLQSRNPVAIEPGRFTAILEPQAVYDFTQCLVEKTKILEPIGGIWGDGWHPYNRQMGVSHVGDKLLDSRLSLRADPMDPDLGFVPFDLTTGEPCRPAVWFEQGVLTHLPYTRRQALAKTELDQYGNVDIHYTKANPQPFDRTRGLLNTENYRMDLTGTPSSMADMIASTKRGILVTRFTEVQLIHTKSLMVDGFTRDGLWLIENGTVSKAIKNFRFAESVMGALNRIEQFGVPQRVFCPGKAVVVPALKLNDFNFVGLIDAV